LDESIGTTTWADTVANVRVGVFDLDSRASLWARTVASGIPNFIGYGASCWARATAVSGIDWVSIAIVYWTIAVAIILT